MGTLTANATANLTANGAQQGSGTIAWTEPSMPSGVTFWDSVMISGMWSWNGKGHVQAVTIAGTRASADTTFNIDIKGQTSPLNITCEGNKNATGNQFIWTGPTVTYTYTRYINVSAEPSTNGTFTLSQSGSVPENTSITINAIPNKGYEVTGYYVNGSKIDSNTFIAANDSVVSVTFAEIQQKIFYKDNGVYVATSEVYIKEGGSWNLIPQTELKFTFNGTKSYRKL